jgi:CheY-like chemotaxis protein
LISSHIFSSGVEVGPDLSMPDMDGVTLIREAQRRRPGLPAILLTGYATNAAEIALGGAVSGAFSLLRKPIHGQHLAERVTELLEPVSASG